MAKGRKEKASADKDKEKEKEKEKAEVEVNETATRTEVDERLTQTEWWRQAYREILDTEMADFLLSHVVDPAADMLFDMYVKRELVPYVMENLEGVIKNICQWENAGLDLGEEHVEKNPTWVENPIPKRVLMDTWSAGGHLRRTMLARDKQREALEKAQAEAAARLPSKEEIERRMKVRSQAISGAAGQAWRLRDYFRERKQAGVHHATAQDHDDASRSAPTASRPAQATIGHESTRRSVQAATGHSDTSSSAVLDNRRNATRQAQAAGHGTVSSPAVARSDDTSRRGQAMAARDLPRTETLAGGSHTVPVPSQAAARHGTLQALPQGATETAASASTDMPRRIPVAPGVLNQSEFLGQHGYANVFRASGPFVPQPPPPRTTRQLPNSFRQRQYRVVGSVEPQPPTGQQRTQGKARGTIANSSNKDMVLSLR